MGKYTVFLGPITTDVQRTRYITTTLLLSQPLYTSGYLSSRASSARKAYKDATAQLDALKMTKRSKDRNISGPSDAKS